MKGYSVNWLVLDSLTADDLRALWASECFSVDAIECAFKTLGKKTSIDLPMVRLELV